LHISIDLRGKQSPREGMAGRARRQMGRGREDDAAGGILISFLIELLDNVGQGLVFESNK
jgi:hypothetical protein